MRRSVVLVVMLFLAPPAQGATGCEASPPRGPAGLAGTILVKGACGTFAFRRDGIVQLHERLQQRSHRLLGVALLRLTGRGLRLLQRVERLGELP